MQGAFQFVGGRQLYVGHGLLVFLTVTTEQLDLNQSGMVVGTKAVEVGIVVTSDTAVSPVGRGDAEDLIPISYHVDTNGS